MTQVADQARQGPHQLYSADADVLQALVRRGSDIIVVSDPNGAVVWVSPSISGLGYTPEEFLGKSGIDLVHPDDFEVAFDAFFAAGEESAPVRLRVCHADGSWRHLSVAYTNLLDDPKVVGIVANARDITERVEAENALRRNEEWFRQFASSAPVGIIFCDADSNVTFVNDRWVEITGIPRDEATGACWERVLHPDESERTALGRAALARDGRAAVDCRIVRVDGEVIWVRGQTVLVRGSDGFSVGFVSSIEDVTAEQAARERAVRWAALAEHSLDMVSIYDAEGRFVYVSPSHERVLGYSKDELIGLSPLDLLHPEERDDVATAFAEQILGAGEPVPVQHRFLHKDGSWRYLESIAVDLSGDPTIGGILVNGRDVTDRRRAELVSRDQASILEGVARGVPLRSTLEAVVEMVERWMPGGRGAITRLDVETDSLHIAAAPSLDSGVLAELQGLAIGNAVKADYPVGFFVAELGSDGRYPETARALGERGFRSWWAHPMDDPTGTHRLGGVMVLRRDNEHPTDADRSLVGLAAALAAVAIERDRTASQLEHQARHDALTGLPNREQVVHRLRRVTNGEGGDGSSTAVLFLDLDRFKVLNDSVGHDAGDQLLVEMGIRLKQALRPGDLVARFGGDEFVMVCERVDDEQAAVELAERVLDVVSQPFSVAGAEVVVTASIGISIVDDRPPEALLRDADAAMYSAKDRGRSRIELFDERLRERAVARLDTERELRRALDVGGLVLHYQPVVSLLTDKLVGFEALLRWEHDERGLLYPADFLGVAEECGLIRPIGAWVRDEACRQAARWRDEHPEWDEFVMGFNLSAGELMDPHLGRNIARTIDETGVDPKLVSIEITERLLFEDEVAARVLFNALRDLGVLLALDDFGTGYSPLVHLKEFPVHAIKIDRSFVSGLGVDPFDDAIVQSVIALADRLELFSIAEGVETEEQMEQLRRLGCLLAQGFCIARALPVVDAEELVAHRFLAAGQPA